MRETKKFRKGWKIKVENYQIMLLSLSVAGLFWFILYLVATKGTREGLK